MQNNTITDLTVVHENMVKTIQQHLPGIENISAYNPVENYEYLKLPAVLIEAGEIEPASKISGGRSAISIDFAIHCMLSTQRDDVQLQARNFAVRMIQILEGQRWGLHEAAKRPIELSAYPGAFNPDNKGFESWIVYFKQTFHLGTVEIINDTPDAVWLCENGRNCKKIK